MQQKIKFTYNALVRIYLFYLQAGADLLSRGGGADFQKRFENENFVDLFFRSTKLIISALPH